MTNEEAINVLKTDSCYECTWGCTSAAECANSECSLKEAVNMAIKALEKQIEYRWHNIIDNPTDTPDKYNCDWVLAQIVEDNGFVWIPKLAEFRVAKDDWYCDDANGWLNDSNGLFKVVAWCKLPTNDWSDSND